MRWRWKAVKTASANGFGYSRFGVDIVPTVGAALIEWTLHWPEQDRWLGYNVEVKIEGN